MGTFGRQAVGHRIAMLVLVQALTAISLALLGGRALHRMADDQQLMYDFQVRSLVDIARALRINNELLDDFEKENSSGVSSLDKSRHGMTEDERRLLAALDSFTQVYRSRWLVEGSMSEDATEFREDLTERHKSRLIEDEKNAFGDITRELHRLHGPIERTQAFHSGQLLRERLRSLLDVNDAYAAVSNDQNQLRARRTWTYLLVISFGTVALSVILGLHVRHMIGSRIARLARKVRRFQDEGVNEPVGDSGNDEISILSHALDAGFKAIAEREHDRAHFLSVAAHELKTPVTSILGYSSLLLKHTPSQEQAESALKVIKTQSWRLSRLIEEVIFASRAQAGLLGFHPAQVDLVEVLKDAISDLRAILPEQRFDLTVPAKLAVLGDRLLLGQGLRSLLSFAAARSEPSAPVLVALESAAAVARVTMRLRGAEIDGRGASELFFPFGAAEYESGSGARASTGLYLCREVARLHNGHLRLDEDPGVGPVFTLEIPA